LPKGHTPIRLRLQMPIVDTVPSSRPPDRCPREVPCSGATFRRFGKPKKRVRDLHVHQVHAQRWECTTCGYVFRVYPRGVTHRQQSLRLQAMSTYYWVLGMSLGAVTDALAAQGCLLGRTTVHDNLRQTGTAARRKLRKRLRSKMKVRVVALDFTHVTEQGKDKVVMQATDAGAGMILEITPLHAEDEHTVTRYVRRIAKLTGCEVIVTDDADTFKTAADAADVQHQLCQQHVVPNTLTLLSEIVDQIDHLSPHLASPRGLSVEQAFDDIALLEEAILARASGSQRHLDELCRRYQDAPVPKRGVKASPWYRLRLLTLDLAEDWPRLTLTDRYRDEEGKRLVPATNNVSERGIGMNIKERYRTMRGYKSTTSLRCIPALTAYLREQHGAECLSGLLLA
jgi:transposase-like protein